MANPYQAPSTKPITTLHSGRRFVSLSVLLYVYPLLPVAWAYSAWGLSAIALGRIPVPFRDYPVNLAILVCGYTAASTFLISPVVVPFGFWIAISRPFGWISTPNVLVVTRVASLGVFCALLAVVCLVFRYDPGGALTWFFD